MELIVENVDISLVAVVGSSSWDMLLQSLFGVVDDEACGADSVVAVLVRSDGGVAWLCCLIGA